MEQENKNTTGAPSNDTTSALFVSARKKQLEQQETERRAKEKEEKRLAAEAEVQRLEREVEERRRKAEADAKLAEQEAKRIAEEARAKKTQAAENPDAVLGAQPEKKEVKLPQIPKVSMPSIPKPAKPAAPAGGGEAVAKPPLNVKMLAIIGGGVVALILIVVLVLSMGGGGSGSDYEEYPAPDGYITYSNTERGIAFSYPDWFYEPEEVPYGDTSFYIDPIVARSDYHMVLVCNYTGEYQDFVSDGEKGFDEFLGEFVEGVFDYIEESTENLQSVTFTDYDEYDDGSMDQGVTLIFNSGVRCFAAIGVDGYGDASAVFFMGISDNDDVDTCNIIIDSAVAFEVE